MKVYNGDEMVASVEAGSDLSEIAEAYGVEVEDLRVEYTDAEKMKALRYTITTRAGDPLSLLGTASDGASLALLSVIAHTVAVADNDSYEAYRDQFIATSEAMSNGGGVVDASRQFLAGVQAGSVLLPPMAKGFTEVIEEVVDRGRKVTEAIAESRAAA